MLALGWNHYKAGRYLEVDRICREVLRTDPENADAWHLLGMTSLRLGRLGEAESSFVRALGARPDATDAHSNLGIALALQGRLDRAIVPSDELAGRTAELRGVNRALWQVEDELRQSERAGDFGPRFIELARSVYRLNDRRASLKRQINQTLGSRLMEEKSYQGDG